MFLLLCSFSGIAQARSEVPDNLMENKESKINEMVLGATEGISLVRNYTAGTESINLEWTAPAEGTITYKIYQSKNGATEALVSTITGNKVTLNESNAKIKDEAVPNAPKVTATKNADETGYTISVTESTDSGTTYRHRMETTVKSSINYTEKSWTEPGTYTWTAPEGVTKIRVAVCGGGRRTYLKNGPELQRQWYTMVKLHLLIVLLPVEVIAQQQLLKKEGIVRI